MPLTLSSALERVMLSLYSKARQQLPVAADVCDTAASAAPRWQFASRESEAEEIFLDSVRQNSVVFLSRVCEQVVSRG